MEESFSQAILVWYRKNARQLPWRGIHDPYATWVSEIMLQQTRVETVIPYFQKWMVLFPTLFALASSREQDVLIADTSGSTDLQQRRGPGTAGAFGEKRSARRATSSSP